MSTINGIDYGPLFPLLGKWIGTRGLDKAPDHEGEPDRTQFIDELNFQVAGAAENAEEQELVAVRYHHVVRKQENGKIFHDQIGHWLYEPATGLVMHSLTIPRGVCLLAGGTVTEKAGSLEFEVSASADSQTFGIVQSPFMFEKAKTTSFSMTMTLDADRLSYRESTMLHIYGKEFDHVDKSELFRVVYDAD